MQKGYCDLLEVDCFQLIGADVEVSQVLQQVAGRGGLVYLVDEVEGDVQPVHLDLGLVVDLLEVEVTDCLLYTSPSPRDQRGSRMPSSA